MATGINYAKGPNSGTSDSLDAFLETLQTRVYGNPKVGKAILTAGTVTITDSAVRATSIIIVCYGNGSAPTAVPLYISGQTAGSFVINGSGDDNGISVNYAIFN